MRCRRYTIVILTVFLTLTFSHFVQPFQFASATLEGSTTRTEYATVYNSTGSDGHIWNQSTTYNTVRYSTEGTVVDTYPYARLGQRKLGSQYYCYPVFQVFPTISALPENAVVDSLKLCLYGNGTYMTNPSPDFSVTVMYSGSCPHDPLESADMDLTKYGGSYGTFDTAGWTVNAWNNITLSPVLLTYLISNPRLALFSSRQINGDVPTAGTEYVDVASGESEYPARLEVTYHIDATYSSSERVLRDPFQRKTFEVGSRTFVLMNNATTGYANLVSTVNGSYWLDPLNIGAYGGDYSERGALFFDGTYVHFAWYDGNTYDTWYRRGLPYENGTVDLSSAQLVWNGTADFGCIMPSICVSTDGYAFVAAQQSFVSSPYTQVVLWKNSLNDGSWVTDWEYNCTAYSGAGKAGRATIVQLPSGKMGFLVSMNTYLGAVPIGFYLWSGSSWTLENQIVSNHTSLHADFVTAVNVGEEIHFAYVAYASGNSVYYKKRDAAGVWESGETLLCSGSPGEIGVELTNFKDEAVLLFWSNSSSSQIFKRQRWLAGPLWSDAQVVGTAEGQLTNMRTLQAPYYCNSTVKLVYQVNTSAPYYLRLLDAGTDDYLVDSYADSNRDADRSISAVHPSSSSSCSAAAQSFTALPLNKNLTVAMFYLKRLYGSPGFLVARLYSHSGTYGSGSVPGTLLATSTPVNASGLSSSYSLVTFNFPTAEQYLLQANVKYVISVEAFNGTWDSSNYVMAGYDSSSPTHSGNMARYASGGWDTVAGGDLVFSVYGIFTSTVDWHDVETWTFDVYSSSGLAWHDVETWDLIVRAERWNPVETWTFTVGAESGWHTVETWNLSLVTSAGWRNVELWSFSLSSLAAGWNNVETWSLNLSASSTAAWRNVETWSLFVNGSGAWRDAEWWTLLLNASAASWKSVETWNLTLNSSRVWYVVENWNFEVTTTSKTWHTVEAWNFSGQAFHVGFAWPAHVPFYLSAFGTYVDFNETAYFDAFQLDANLVTFYNVSMGTGESVPRFGVATLQVNITFTDIDYLHEIGFDAWASPSVVGPLSWYGNFYGAFDPLIDAPPSTVYFDGVSYSSGTYWDTVLNENLLSTHWGVPPNVHVLLDWGALPIMFWSVESWLFYPYTGLAPNFPSALPLPIMSIMGLIGLVSMFGGPLYGISKFKKKEYYSGAVVGLIFFVVGFALFIAWLWSS